MYVAYSVCETRGNSHRPPCTGGVYCDLSIWCPLILGSKVELTISSLERNRQTLVILRRRKVLENALDEYAPLDQLPASVYSQSFVYASD